MQVFTCFPFLVKLNDLIDDCDIGVSAPLAFPDHLRIPAFVCTQPDRVSACQVSNASHENQHKDEVMMRFEQMR